MVNQGRVDREGGPEPDFLVPVGPGAPSGPAVGRRAAGRALGVAGGEVLTETADPSLPHRPVVGGRQGGDGGLGHWGLCRGRRPREARRPGSPGGASTQVRREEAWGVQATGLCSPPFWGPLPRPHPPSRFQSWGGADGAHLPPGQVAGPRAHGSSVRSAGPAPPRAHPLQAWHPARPSPSASSLFLTFCILVSFPVGFCISLPRPPRL